MTEEGEEGTIVTEHMDKPLEENEVGPTSIDVTDERISIGQIMILSQDQKPYTIILKNYVLYTKSVEIMKLRNYLQQLWSFL